MDQHAIHERIRYEYFLHFACSIFQSNSHYQYHRQKLQLFNVNIINYKNSHHTAFKLQEPLKNPYLIEVIQSEYHHCLDRVHL